MIAGELGSVADLPLVDQIQILVTATYAGCRGYLFPRLGNLEVRQLPASASWTPILPEFIIDAIQSNPAEDVRLPLVTFDERASGPLLDVPALWTEISFKRSWNETARSHVADSDAQAALSPLLAFSLQPTFIVDTTWSAIAVWLLGEPAHVDEPSTCARVDDLQRALADRLGGRIDEVQLLTPKGGVGVSASTSTVDTETVPAWHVKRPVFRLPGTRNCEFSRDGEPVTLAIADLSRRYALEEIARAVTQPERKRRRA